MKSRSRAAHAEPFDFAQDVLVEACAAILSQTRSKGFNDLMKALVAQGFAVLKHSHS
jgi:hypothetical protein